MGFLRDARPDNWHGAKERLRMSRRRQTIIKELIEMPALFLLEG